MKNIITFQSDVFQYNFFVLEVCHHSIVDFLISTCGNEIKKFKCCSNSENYLAIIGDTSLLNKLCITDALQCHLL